MNKSESIGKLASALSKAQGMIKGAVKDSVNPHFRNKYADLTSVWEACREALTKHELSVVQLPETSEGQTVKIETMLMHSSGEWISSTIELPVQKYDAQGYGSALTYARRYALAAIVGVAPEDDDGNAAAAAAPTKPEPAKVDPAARKTLEACKTLEELQEAWKGLSAAQRSTCGSIKDAMKAKLTEQVSEAA